MLSPTMRTGVLQAPATPRSARSAPAAPAGEAFRPRISARARARPARSAAEMSAGDRMRREAALVRAPEAASSWHACQGAARQPAVCCQQGSWAETLAWQCSFRALTSALLLWTATCDPGATLRKA